MSIKTIREALETARNDFHTLAHSHDGDFDEEGLRNFGSICERQVNSALSALSALSTIDPTELYRVKKERDDYKLWWERATETHTQLRKLYDEQNAKMWAILKRPECPGGLAQRMLKMPEADRDYFLSLAVDTIVEEYQEISLGVWQTPSMAYAEAAWKDMIAAGEHGPKAQHRMIETLAEHFKAHDEAIRRDCADRARRAMLDPRYSITVERICAAILA